jgi:hypothetical protein
MTSGVISILASIIELISVGIAILSLGINMIRQRHGRQNTATTFTSWLWGGAGNTAALIDGLANAIEQAVSKWPESLDEESARSRLERVLVAYHARQVRFYPVDDDHKLLRFVVCIRNKLAQEVYLWRTDGTTVERVEKYALIEWEEALYDYVVRRLYQHNITTPAAVLLGIHLFTVAYNSLYIGGDTQVIVVTKDNMRLRSDAKFIQERLK